MVDKLDIPRDLTSIIDVKVINNTDILRRFLVDLLLKINELENRIVELENAP